MTAATLFWLLIPMPLTVVLSVISLIKERRQD